MLQKFGLPKTIMVFPRWFNALPDGEGHYSGYYCQSCVQQGSNLNQCKSQYFCIDCATSNLCQSCFMTFGTHTRHDKVQVYKATFRDAVREADIKKGWDHLITVSFQNCNHIFSMARIYTS